MVALLRSVIISKINAGSRGKKRTAHVQKGEEDREQGQGEPPKL